VVKLPGNVKKTANLFAPKSQGKRLKIKRLAGFFRVYPAQSVHAPHSEEVNAARAYDWPDKRATMRFDFPGDRSSLTQRLPNASG
jgi:hypothetical protein